MARADDTLDRVAEALAHALAATWSGSQAGAPACAGMQRLLPGLQYMR